MMAFYNIISEFMIFLKACEYIDLGIKELGVFYVNSTANVDSNLSCSLGGETIKLGFGPYRINSLTIYCISHKTSRELYMLSIFLSHCL